MRDSKSIFNRLATIKANINIAWNDAEGNQELQDRLMVVLQEVHLLHTVFFPEEMKKYCEEAYVSTAKSVP